MTYYDIDAQNVAGDQLADEVRTYLGLGALTYCLYKSRNQVQFDGIAAGDPGIQAICDAHIPDPYYFPDGVERAIKEGALDEARAVPDFMAWTPAEADAAVAALGITDPVAKAVLRKMAQNLAALNGRVFPGIRYEKNNP